LKGRVLRRRGEDCEGNKMKNGSDIEREEEKTM
jgi:hypothetical protein